MNEQIRFLAELQKLDTKIISLDKTTKAIPLRISAMDPPLKEAKTRLEGREKKLEAAEKKKRDREQELEENNDRLQKLRKRTLQIKDNKAYQAHLKEIGAAERVSATIEDEIIGIMEAIEAETVEVKAAAGELEKKGQETSELRKELEEEVHAVREKLESMKAGRAGFIRSLEKENYKTYLKLLTEHGGLAVVVAENEVCGGCNMNIMPQLYVRVKKNEEIIQCPQCKRILYYTEQPGEGREAE